MIYAELDENDNIIKYSNKNIGKKIYEGVDTSKSTTGLDIAKLEAKQKIRDKFSNIVQESKKNYSDYELESFIDQRIEWRAWSADNNAATPTVDALANARGVDRLVLLNKIGQKVIELMAIQGEQNRLEDVVADSTTYEELNSVLTSI